MATVRSGAAAVFLSVLVLLAGPVASAATDVPSGFEIIHHEPLAEGVEHLSLRDPATPQSVHIVRVAADAPVVLRSVLSNNRVAGPRPRLERTSSMCNRIQCIAAVNADFAFPSTNDPVGAVVSHRELQRSPNRAHHQLLITPNGLQTSASIEWNGRLVPTDLRELVIDGVNVPRRGDDLVLYTPAQAPFTGTNRHGVEVPFEIVRPEGPLRLGQTALVRLLGLHDGGNLDIPPNGGVLSGHGAGADALYALWARVEDGRAAPEALLRLESTPEVSESVGGSPILVRDGQRWFQNDPTSFIRSRHPRTLAGWTAEGDILLVTVDGRQTGHAAGMTLAEASDLMIGLGAIEAINLDGGGSTTFVTHGEVRNRPSDQVVRRDGRTRIVAAPRAGEQVLGHVERPVVSALAVVPRTAGPAAPPSPLSPDDVALPQALLSEAPPQDDPASDPRGYRPALVLVPEPGEPTSTSEPPLLPVSGALVALAAALALLADPRFRPHIGGRRSRR